MKLPNKFLMTYIILQSLQLDDMQEEENPVSKSSVDILKSNWHKDKVPHVLTESKVYHIQII